MLPAWVPQAAAAGVALAIGLGLGFGLGQRSGDTPGGLLAATGLVAQGSPLHALLESARTGQAHDCDVRFGLRVTQILAEAELLLER